MRRTPAQQLRTRAVQQTTITASVTGFAEGETSQEALL